MDTITHLFVLPVTGPQQGKGKTCYVCQYGSSPVLLAFIKRNTPQLDLLVEYVQKIKDRQPKLQALVVVLSGPEEEIMQKLKKLNDERKLTVPIAVLDPETGLPDSMAVNPDAQLTLVLYLGKHVENIGELKPGSLPRIMSLRADVPPHSTGSRKFMSLAINTLPQVPEFVTLDANTSSETSELFREFDKAAKEMIDRGYK